MSEHSETPISNRKVSPFGYLFRLIGWWFGFTGLYGMFSVCPFCGQPGCPIGMASAGTIGAFLSLCVQDWKRLFAYLCLQWAGKPNPEEGCHHADRTDEHSTRLYIHPGC